MLVRFLGLFSLLIVCVNSQSYAQGNYNSPSQYGNHLHNQFPQGAGGSYPNSQHQTSYSQSYPQGSNQNAQFGARYQSSSIQVSTPSSRVAHGVVQHKQPRAQPLPSAFTSPAPNTELAPLATAEPTFPPPVASQQPQVAQQSFTNYPQPQVQQQAFTNYPQPQVQQQTFTNYPQSQGNFFYPPVPPQYSGNQQFQQPPPQQFQQPTNFNQNYNNPYANATSQQQQQYREPVVNYTFKEGTPPYYCAYGLPVPEYNTPRKRCVPWHPMYGTESQKISQFTNKQIQETKIQFNSGLNFFELS